jgi:hypothetical protein
LFCGEITIVKIVHNLLAETAKAIAKEAYESMAHNNAFYAEWPTVGSYVHANWTLHLPEVRAQFVKILAGDYPDAMKQPIYEAMCIDGSQRLSREERRKIESMRTKTRVLN